jgi:hypothetical protein
MSTRDTLVSVERWRKTSCNGNEIEFAAVQLEHFGFTLSRSQAEEFCRKLIQLRSGKECHTDEDDTLFVDLDKTTGESPFVILATSFDSRHLGWFCDIPVRAAKQLYEKLTERLQNHNGEMNCATS